MSATAPIFLRDARTVVNGDERIPTKRDIRRMLGWPSDRQWRKWRKAHRAELRRAT